MERFMITKLKYDEKGLIPAIIQDISTNEVLMLAYMDKAALQKTIETGMTYFWSRSRQKYWMKGGTMFSSLRRSFMTVMKTPCL